MPKRALRLLSFGFCLLGPGLAVVMAPMAPDCAWRRVLDIPCPGCGLGHGLAAVGRGDLPAACLAYPPLPVLGFFWLMCLLVLWPGPRGLVRLLPWTAAAVSSTVMGNWALRLLNG